MAYSPRRKTAKKTKPKAKKDNSFNSFKKMYKKGDIKILSNPSPIGYSTVSDLVMKMYTPAGDNVSDKPSGPLMRGNKNRGPSGGLLNAPNRTNPSSSSKSKVLMPKKKGK